MLQIFIVWLRIICNRQLPRLVQQMKKTLIFILTSLVIKLSKHWQSSDCEIQKMALKIFAFLVLVLRSLRTNRSTSNSWILAVCLLCS